MRLDPRMYMSLSNNSEQPEKAIDSSQSNAMVLSDELELPAKVANVSRDELRKYAQCKRVGNYLLGRTVGEGSFAKVKEAVHILTGEKVAIKIIDKNRARKDRYVSKNMRREARLLQMIRHPHIVQLLEIVETSQCYYLVFEFADGGDLMDHICKRKKLDENEVRKFIRQIISAVEYLHRLGIMHRDLKVENLLLDANKNIKIIDFGLSNTIYSPDSNNENHCLTQCGSPAYAAPELLVRKDYGPQIDVWSIGVNLYAMLTGRLPYTVEPFNISTLYNKMLRRQMNEIPEYLSEDCKDMIHQLLNPDPKERLHILEAIRHKWITMDERDPLVLVPCPNYLHEEDLDDRILDHVEEQLKLNSDDIIRDVIQNKATKNSCIYHLLVRRLERYEREERKLTSEAPPTIQLTESKPPSSPEHISPPSPNHSNTQKNGLVKRSLPKTHIIENPFKTIKVALIRQKKAVKNEERSKAGKTSGQGTTSNSTTNSEATNKPKSLCAVKRVALVKFSPARRSLRGLTSLSRNCTNSPKPGRRKSYFEGLQQRRKSPKVRRRHAEPDDSLSSSVSTSRRTSIDNTDNVGSTAQRMRTEDKLNNNTAVLNSENSSAVGSSDTKFEKYTGETLPLENIPENGTHTANTNPGTNTSETVTHLYTEKGVVLKRNSSGENCETNYKQEQGTVQHHVFHGGDKTRIIGGIKDERERPRINGFNSQQATAESAKVEVDDKTRNIGGIKDERERPRINGFNSQQATAESAKVEVDAKISSLPHKTTEIAKPTSQRSSISNTTTTRQTARMQPLKTKTTLSKQTAQKAVTPRKTPYKLDNSSKIPVMAGKNSVVSRQFPQSPTRPVARTAVTPSLANTRLPGTAARRNDVARLADKYDKCVSVVVAACSTDVGKRSTTVEKEPASNHNTTKGTATKGFVPKVERLNVMNDLKNRNGLNEKRAGVTKGLNPSVKEQTLQERGADPNSKSGENNTKQKSVEEKETKEKTTGQLRNGLQRSKIQDQANRKPSLVKSAKESLNASRNMSTTKDTKQATENARKNSTSERNGKALMAGHSTSKRASVKSQETTEDTKSWTEDARRKISNYRKTNEPQQKASVVKREVKTVTSIRNSALKTS